MPKKEDEQVKRLLEENKEFRDSYNAHKDCESKLLSMEKRPHLSDAGTIEKKNLKKLKLAMKDKMERIISGHRG